MTSTAPTASQHSDFPGRIGPRLARHGALASVLIVLILVVWVRLRVADVPLERDEGEYAYAGQLILRGVPPYLLAYNMKFPGVYYAYALILAVFGQTARAVHLGLLVVNTASVLLLFFLVRRLLRPLPAAVAASSFAVLSLDRWVMGVFAHATHFVVFFALAGLMVLLRAFDRPRGPTWFASGILLGTAVLMKQHGVFFPALGIVLAASSALAEEARDFRRAASRACWFGLGALAPLLVLAVVFLVQGVFGRFWFWTFRYAREYVSTLPVSAAVPMLVRGWKDVTVSTFWFWVLAALGGVALSTARWPGRARAVLMGLLVASFLATCPGFYFRQHYFVVILPAVASLCGVAADFAERAAARRTTPAMARLVALALPAAVVAFWVVGERGYLFSMDVRTLSRAQYGQNPFVESPEIAAYIRDRTEPGDRIAVLGSEPQIYFYSERASASGYIYTYPLMEPQPFAVRMQDEMIREIQAAHPKYLVLVQVHFSWLVRPNSERRILSWGERYAGACYEMVGVADILSPQQTAMLWDERARGYRPRSPNVVYTFRRRGDGPCSVDG